MPQSYLDSELYLPSPGRARFSWAGHEHEGAPCLQTDRILELIALELTPEMYGRELFNAVFPVGSPLREGLHDAVLEAERGKSRLRVRLHLSPELPDRIHGLYWELLADPVHRLALARSPDTAFCRYSAVPRALGIPVTGRPRLLCVVSAPSDVERFQMVGIDRGDVLSRIENSLSDLDIEVTFLEPPATPGRIRERLVGGGFHLLHLFGHGLIHRPGVSALVLEDEHGRVRFVEEELLAEVFLGDRDLRLVTLVACHGGEHSSADAFSGLAGRLVQRGLPAVVAMRRAVSVERAHVFNDHLYRELARTGRVDAAVNEARQQLYLEEPQSIGWSSPVLYQRLVDGKLWLTPDEAPSLEQKSAEASLSIISSSLTRPLRPLSWLPAAFLWLATAIPSLWPGVETAQLDRLASRLSIRVVESCVALKRLVIEEIAAIQLAATRKPTSLPTPRDMDAASDTIEDALFTIQSFSATDLPVVPQSPPPDFESSATPKEGVSYEAPQVDLYQQHEELQPDPSPPHEAVQDYVVVRNETQGIQDANYTRRNYEEQISPPPLKDEEPDSEEMIQGDGEDDSNFPRQDFNCSGDDKITYKLGLLPGEVKDPRAGVDAFNAATDAFVAARRFTMLERKQLNAVFTEKDLQEFIGGQVNNKLCDILGLDLLGIVGYTVETTRPNNGSPVTNWIIDVRLIDVKTAKLVAIISSVRPGALIQPANPREAGKQLFKSIREAFSPFGYIVRVNGKEAIVDLGSDAGVKNGDVLEVIQEGEQIIHPVTGQVLPSPMKVVGELKVISADLQLSTCKFKPGKTEIKPADRVRLKEAKSIVPDWLLKLPQMKDEMKRKRDAMKEGTR